MANAENVSSPLKETITKIVDTTLILAAISGMLYICGYVYHEAYYGGLGLPVKFLSLSINDLLLFGVLPMPVILMGTGAIFIFIALFKNWPLKLYPDKKTMSFEAMLGVRLILLVLIFGILIYLSYLGGNDAAKKFLDGQCQLSELVFKTNVGDSTTKMTGCLIAINNENYWLKKVECNGGLGDEIFVLPAPYFLSGTIKGVLSNHKSQPCNESRKLQ